MMMILNLAVFRFMLGVALFGGVMLVFLLVCVVVLDGNFDDERLHVELIWDLFEHVDIVRNANFLEHWHLNLFDHRVLLNVMMMYCVNAHRLFVLYFAVKRFKLSYESCLKLFKNSLMFLFFSSINRREQSRCGDGKHQKFLKSEKLFSDDFR